MNANQNHLTAKDARDAMENTLPLRTLIELIYTNKAKVTYHGDTEAQRKDREQVTGNRLQKEQKRWSRLRRLKKNVAFRIGDLELLTDHIPIFIEHSDAGHFWSVIVLSY